MAGSDSPVKSSSIVLLLAGWAALTLLVYSLLTMILLVTLGGAPGSAQEILSMWQTGRLAGFTRLDGRTGVVLIQTAMVIFYVLMVRTDAFSKWTAWMGILTHGPDLLRMLAGFVVPAAGFLLMAVAGPFYLLRFPLLARDCFRIAAGARE